MEHDDFNEEELYSSDVFRPMNVPTPVQQAAAVAASPASFIAPPPSESDNPLAGYFRLPGLTVSLPTGGRYMPRGTVEFDRLGRLEVFAMGGTDEALLKSPDALMSGLAIEKMIQSCVPGIKSPKLLSAPDLDVILIAIRAASYGNTMDMEVQCPECDARSEFEVDLPTVLDTMSPIPDILELRLSSEVVLTLQPHTLDAQTKLLIRAYEENRKAQALDEDIPEERKAQILSETVDRVREFQDQSLSNAISYVTTPAATVMDRTHIIEFVKKMKREWKDKLLAEVEKINGLGIDRNLPVVCSECKHEWTTVLEFNPSTFFGQSSSA